MPTTLIRATAVLAGLAVSLAAVGPSDAGTGSAGAPDPSVVVRASVGGNQVQPLTTAKWHVSAGSAVLAVDADNAPGARTTVEGLASPVFTAARKVCVRERLDLLSDYSTNPAVLALTVTAVSTDGRRQVFGLPVIEPYAQNASTVVPDGGRLYETYSRNFSFPKSHRLASMRVSASLLMRADVVASKIDFMVTRGLCPTVPGTT